MYLSTSTVLDPNPGNDWDKYDCLMFEMIFLCCEWHSYFRDPMFPHLVAQINLMRPQSVIL